MNPMIPMSPMATVRTYIPANWETAFLTEIATKHIRTGRNVARGEQRVGTQGARDTLRECSLLSSFGERVKAAVPNSNKSYRPSSSSCRTLVLSDTQEEQEEKETERQRKTDENGEQIHTANKNTTLVP